MVERNSELNKNLAELNKEIKGLTGKIPSIGGAFSKLGDILATSIEFGDKASRMSLALGKTYEESMGQFNGTMDQLRGSLDQRFTANILALESGLQGNAKGVAKLINQQQLTNTNFTNTAKALANVEASLGSSRESTNAFAESIISTGTRFEISTDKLVNAVDALKGTFTTMNLAGMGPQVLGIISLLNVIVN